MNPFTEQQQTFKQLELHLHTIGNLIETRRLKRESLSSLDREYIANTRKSAEEFGISRLMIQELINEGVRPCR